MARPLFRQLFDLESSTYSYLIADAESHEAILIDPVFDKVERDFHLICELGLKLLFTLETHVHADHITGAGRLAEKTGAKIALGRQTGAKGADLLLDDGVRLNFGSHFLDTISTPGHTAGCTSYKIGEWLFTGDSLLIRTAGRTDFQGGSAEALYKSVTQKLFVLADETQVFPGHDYSGFTSSTIAEEKNLNARLGVKHSLKDFVTLMEGLNLPPPKKMSSALPVNMNCGRKL